MICTSGFLIKSKNSRRIFKHGHIIQQEHLKEKNLKKNKKKHLQESPENTDLDIICTS